MLSENDIFDITIIGGGPVGMFAAFYAGMRNAKTKLIETLPVLGGQVALLYPDKTIYDVGGYIAVTGKELIHELTGQMQHFDQDICLEEQVQKVEKTEKGVFKLTTPKAVHYSKTIIVATGQGAFRPRKVALNRAERFEENNLHYIVRQIDQYRGKTVAICGGGDSAVDWALSLENVAKKVYLIHRRNKFRAHEASVTRLEHSSVEILTPYVPNSLHGDENTLKAITIKEARGDKTRTLNVDYFIVNYGFVSSIGPVKDWGLEREKSEIIVTPKMETNIDGLYAVGDIATYEGKIKLIATGFGEAPTAVNHAIHYIHPEERTQPIQSTKLQFED